MANALTVIAVVYVVSGAGGLLSLFMQGAEPSPLGAGGLTIQAILYGVALVGGVQLYRERFSGLVLVRMLATLSIPLLLVHVVSGDGHLLWGAIKIALTMLIAGTVWAPAATQLCRPNAGVTLDETGWRVVTLVIVAVVALLSIRYERSDEATNAAARELGGALDALQLPHDAERGSRIVQSKWRRVLVGERYRTATPDRLKQSLEGQLLGRGWIPCVTPRRPASLCSGPFLAIFSIASAPESAGWSLALDLQWADGKPGPLV